MSEVIRMRTRMLPSMTNYEVEEYLQRNDIIFVPIGVQEMHGGMPLDIEYVGAEAYSRVIAELVDGLVLPNLVYCTAGGTVIGRGTVYMNMTNSIEYVLNICHSLLNQGFRRIVLVPAHGDSKIIINAVTSVFFDDTKCPMLYLDPGAVMRYKGVGLPFGHGDPEHPRLVTSDEGIGCATISLGYYNICGGINDVPTGEEVNNQPGTLSNAYLGKPDPWPFSPIDGYEELSDLLKAYASNYMPIPIYFRDWSDHGSSPLPLTREEVNREGEIGEKLIREAVAKVDWNRYMEGVRKADRCFQEVIIPRYKDVLPKNRYYPNMY